MAVVIDVARSSRLKFSNLLESQEAVFWSLDETPQFPEDEQDIQYVVKENDRIDSIAFQFYGDPVLMWVIAKVNGLRFMPFDLKAGKLLRIPAVRVVRSQVLTR